MQPLIPYRPRDYRRTCDHCASVYLRSDLIKQDNMLVCPTCVDRWGPITKSKIEANAKKPTIRGVRDAAPLQTNPFYEADEHRILELLTTLISGGGFSHLNVTNGDGSPVWDQYAYAMGWAGVYLDGLRQDANRSAAWNAKAASLLTAAADILLSLQFTTGQGNLTYGSFSGDNGVWSTEETAMGGLTCLYAYRYSGAAKYLTGAQRAATQLRYMQAAHLWDYTQVTGKLAEGYTGAFIHSVNAYSVIVEEEAWLTGATMDWGAYPGDLVAVWFLKELLTTAGDGTYGSTGISLGHFTSSPATLLSTMITDGRAVWTTGLRDHDSGLSATGDLITGLSATTPFEYYDTLWLKYTGGPDTENGTGDWTYNPGTDDSNNVSGLNFAKALWALYLYEGYSSQVSSVNTWLRGMDSNIDWDTPSDTSDSAVANGLTGTYAPNLALASLLIINGAQSPSQQGNGSAYYEWSTTGLLSGIQASRDKANLRLAKDALGATYQRFNNGRTSDAVFDYISLRGRSGLSYQTAFTETINGNTAAMRLQDGARAAMVGLCYRQLPYEAGEVT